MRNRSKCCSSFFLHLLTKWFHSISLDLHENNLVIFSNFLLSSIRPSTEWYCSSWCSGKSDEILFSSIMLNLKPIKWENYSEPTNWIFKKLKVVLSGWELSVVTLPNVSVLSYRYTLDSFEFVVSTIQVLYMYACNPFCLFKIFYVNFNFSVITIPEN